MANGVYNSCLFVFGILLLKFMFWDSIKDGKVGFYGSKYYLSKTPNLFWTLVLIYLIMGILAVIISIFLFFYS